MLHYLNKANKQPVHITCPAAASHLDAGSDQRHVHSAVDESGNTDPRLPEISRFHICTMPSIQRREKITSPSSFSSFYLLPFSGQAADAANRFHAVCEQ